MMKVVYHPAVQRDVSSILRHYDGINDRLGDEFWEELNSFISQAAAHPQRFHFEGRDRRRVNLRRFPYPCPGLPGSFQSGPGEPLVLSR